MSGPAATEEFLRARRQASRDETLYITVNGPAMREAARAERLESVRIKCAPLNRRILQGRREVQRRRAKAKRAAQSRRRNRG